MPGVIRIALEVDYLSVGVTSETAVPTRISYGPSTQVRIEFTDTPPKDHELFRAMGVRDRVARGAPKMLEPMLHRPVFVMMS
jgi:hypothetical protein